MLYANESFDNPPELSARTTQNAIQKADFLFLLKLFCCVIRKDCIRAYMRFNHHYILKCLRIRNAWVPNTRQELRENVWKRTTVSSIKTKDVIAS